MRSEQRIVSCTSLLVPHVFRAQVAAARDYSTEPGIALQVHVLHTWWRSWWFTTALVVLLVLAGWIALSRRRRMARQYEVRLEEGVIERTRIIRELHDSLLQGVQGLVLLLQAIRQLLPNRATEAAQALEVALERADRIIIEGREAAQDLRASTVTAADLEKSLRSLGEELAAQSDHKVSYRVIVQGKSRPMISVVRDDVYQVAREAFGNVVRRAQARSIEAELEYGDAAFHLRVRDDGMGIDEGALVGHRGLKGMRERAEALGGRLEVWSTSAGGTEVHLAIPAGTAYGRDPGGRRPSAE